MLDRKISGKPLTGKRYGHNLVNVRAQDLVSNQQRKRGRFWHSPREFACAVGGFFSPVKKWFKTKVGSRKGSHRGLRREKGELTGQ